MVGKGIYFFMWSYQPHFRLKVEYLANDILKELGVPIAGVECLLVGTKIPDQDDRNEVCVEPEDGKWTIDLFEDVTESIETEVANHPDQNVRYSDEISMREKPEKIYRDSVRRAVQKSLDEYDINQDVLSFAGRPAPVGNFYVVPILQIPTAVFERFRPLKELVSDGVFNGHTSLIHAALTHVLDEAHDELLRPDPGRLFNKSRPATEIVREAARSFMHTPSFALKDGTLAGSTLFDRLNMISTLMYEGTQGKGRLLLSNPISGSVDMTLSFTETVPFRESRWARKTLEMASGQTSLVADSEKIFGLGQVAAGVNPWATQDVFQIEFLAHHHWRLSCGDEVLLISRYGIPSLPQERFPIVQLRDTYERLFPNARPSDVSRFMELFQVASNAVHGSTLVVAQDAEREAKRLQQQGARVIPTRLTPDLFQQVSAIDGAVLVDPSGDCHGIGLILDGAAHPECSPARGSRFNSAIRYVYSVNIPRLAVIASADRTVDVVPLLLPKINPSTIHKAIEVLKSSSKDDYHESSNWLNKNRFYLDQQQCDEINAALATIYEEPSDVGEGWIVFEEFVPNPDFNESYLESNGEE